jgi:hypothetical protein
LFCDLLLPFSLPPSSTLKQFPHASSSVLNFFTWLSFFEKGKEKEAYEITLCVRTSPKIFSCLYVIPSCLPHSFRFTFIYSSKRHSSSHTVATAEDGLGFPPYLRTAFIRVSPSVTTTGSLCRPTCRCLNCSFC